MPDMAAICLSIVNLYGLFHVEQAFSVPCYNSPMVLTPKEYKTLYGKLLDQEQRLLGQKYLLFLAWLKLLMKAFMNNDRHLFAIRESKIYFSVQLVVTYLNGRDISVTKQL